MNFSGQKAKHSDLGVCTGGGNITKAAGLTFWNGAFNTAGVSYVANSSIVVV